MDQTNITITRDDVLPYIRTAWNEMCSWRRQMRKTYGARYDFKNPYETIGKRFGNAGNDPGKFADEYILIQQKASRQPSCVRDVIAHIGSRAFWLCYNAKLSQLKEKEAVHE